MNPVRHIRKAAWKCSCLACNLLNLVLALTALAMGSLLCLNLFQQEIPLPDKLAGWILNKAGPEHLQASWSKAVFDLRGGLYLKRFKLENSVTGQTIVTAEETFIKYSLIHLLVPDIPPLTDVRARNIRIYIPVTHSPTGLNEPVLDIRRVYLEEENHQMVLTSMLMESGGLKVHMEGKASLTSLMTGGSEERRPNLYPLLASIRKIPPGLKANISVSWEMLESKSHFLEISGFLPQFKIKDVNLSKVQGSVRIIYSRNGLVVRNMGVHGILNYMGDLPEIPLIELPDEPVAVPFYLHAEGPSWDYQGIQVPSLMNLSLHPKNNQLPFQNLILKATLNPQLDAPFQWIFSGTNAFASGWAIPPQQEGSHPAILSFPSLLQMRAYLPECSIYDFLQAPLPDRLLVGAKADLIRLNATFDPQAINLNGVIAVDGLNIGQTDFAHLYSRLVLNTSVILLDDIFIRKAHNESGYGSYFQEFETTRFSLNAGGAIFPSSLDVILGKWWANIFNDITAVNPLPADVAVWGRWNNLDSLRSFTAVRGKGSSYHGVPIPDLELRIRSNDRWAWLEYLRASFPDGSMEGMIGIRTGLSDSDPYRAYLINLKSDAPWEAVVGASGIESLDIISFKNAHPDLSVRGVLWKDSGRGFESPDDAFIDLSLSHPRGESEIFGLSMKGLNLTGHLEGPLLELNGVTGRFADGIFAGDIQIMDWQSPSEREYTLKISLLDADYPSARSQLSNLLGLSPPTDAADQQDILPGRLDSDLILTLQYNGKNPVGSGHITLRDAQLGTVYILGGLSRGLSGMGMTFTNIEMDSLNLDWQVAYNQMTLSNGLVTGPALSLTLNGDIHLDTREVKMVSDVTLFSGVFSKVLSPVSETMRFDLVGTLDDPTWKLRFNPFRWALNRIAPEE